MVHATERRSHESARGLICEALFSSRELTLQVSLKKRAGGARLNPRNLSPLAVEARSRNFGNYGTYGNVEGCVPLHTGSHPAGPDDLDLGHNICAHQAGAGLRLAIVL